MPLQAGERVGDYEVVGVLGAGGMGQVYKVRNVITKRVEAMKVLLPNLEGNTELADRFIREIEIQASLDHPRIAGLHTAQRAGNQLVMIMEYLEGTTIESLVKQGSIPVAKAVEYCSQLLDALSYAHARGIIHRDIKPANIMLLPSGTVKLMDFGVAKLAGQELTRAGHTVGSLNYMSPEQINTPAALDARSDLYSLGVTLYEMVTGKRPFQGDSDYAVMLGHLARPPEPPASVQPGVPQALSDIILMAMEKEPDKRFQTAEAFRRALMSVSPGAAVAAASPTIALPPQAPPPSVPAPRVRSSRRSLYIAAGSLATVVVLLLAAWQLPRFSSVDAVPQAAAPEPEPAPAAVAQPDPEPQPEREPAPAPPRRSQPVRTQPASTPPSPSPSPEPTPAPATVVETPEPPPTPPAFPSQQFRDTLMSLATRARSVNESLDRLRDEQARSGLGLRGDMVSARQRMEYQLDEAEAALRSEDAARARTSLERAEREIERLESFLGR
jgi:serine/threonine-protein kinase